MADINVVDRLLDAISGQESDGDATVTNSDTGAYGEFQILPKNWASWATQAGLAPDSPQTPANQRIVASNKIGEYIDKYGIEGAARAWYAGEGSLSYSDEALNKPQIINGNEYPSINQYVSEVMGRYGSNETKDIIGTAGFGEFAEIANDVLNPIAPVVEQVEPEEATFYDKLTDAVWDSPIWGAFRTAAVTRDLPDIEDYRVTQEDIDTVQKELGDYTATLWVCQNAHSPEQLARLTQMKKEDLERRKRIEDSDIGLDTAGTILGSVLDPLNFLPAFGAIGKLNKVSKYARMAMLASVGNIAERGAAQAASGYTQDYPMAALMGAIGGAGIPMALDLMGKGLRKTQIVGKQLYGEAVNIEDNAEALAKGQKTSNTRMSKDDFITELSKVHDKAFVKSIKDAQIGGQIRPKHNVYVLSKNDAKRIVEQRGMEWDDAAKGFFDDETGATVLIKENLSGNDDIRVTLLHERGAHGLKYVLSENDYKKVLADLKFRINNNPSPAIERAIKRAGGNADVEEVLGYLAEELKPSNPLLRNIRKAMDKGLNALGVKGRLSDGDFLDILTKSAKYYTEGKQGYRVLKDGSCVYKGIHYSKKNMFNPHNISVAMSFSDIKNTVTDGFMRIMKRNKLYATPFSIGSTSQSETLRRYSNMLFDNPYGGASSYGMPAATYKANMQGVINQHLNNYYAARDEALVKLQHISGTAKQDYNEAVIKEFNKQYAGHVAGDTGEKVDPNILKGVDALKNLREYLRGIMQTPEKYLGNGWGIMDVNYDNFGYDEFYRWIDDNKHADLINKFGSKKALAKAMKQYALSFINKDVVQKQLEKRLEIEWLTECEKLKKAGKELPEKPIITDDMIADEIDKRCTAFGDGVSDTGDSKLSGTANFNMTEIGSLECLKPRLPLDTSGEMTFKLPNGESFVFSYDNNLRSYDVDNFLPMMSDRIAGEVSLTTVFPKGAELPFNNPLGFVDYVKAGLDGVREIVKAELDDKVSRQLMTKDDRAFELEAFDFGVNKLRSMPTPDTPHTLADAVARNLNTYAFARNSGNMVFNQLGEISGTLAYAGFSALFDIFPYMRRLVTDARLGKGSEDILQEALLDTCGETTHKFIFGNANASSSRVYRDILNDTKTARVLDKLAGFANLSASAMSKLTGFNSLTERMINSAQKQTIIDIIRWANGKDFPVYRNPFSNKKMGAIGLNSKGSIDSFRQALKQYVKFDAKGNLIDFDVKKMHSENPDLYMRYFSLVDKQVQRCITMPSVGNTNILKEKSPFWRVFFMFKDFTLRAQHSQTLRVLNNREKDDMLATAYSMLTNLAVVCGLAYARSKFVINKDNNYEHQRYMREYSSPQALMYTALFRSNIIGSPISYVGDALEVTGNSPVPSIRTTTNRYTRNKKADEMIGNYLLQLPAIKTVYDVGQAGANILSSEKYSKRDLNKLLQLLPGQNILPIMYLRDELVKNTGLPNK